MNVYGWDWRGGWGEGGTYGVPESEEHDGNESIDVVFCSAHFGAWMVGFGFDGCEEG